MLKVFFQGEEKTVINILQEFEFEFELKHDMK